MAQNLEGVFKESNFSFAVLGMLGMHNPQMFDNKQSYVTESINKL